MDAHKFWQSNHAKPLISEISDSYRPILFLRPALIVIFQVSKPMASGPINKTHCFVIERSRRDKFI